MLTDRELFVQMIERDVTNLYDILAQNNNILKIVPIQEKIFSYADIGINYLTNLLFGKESENASIDEASEVAKMVAEDKISEYREKLKRKKQEEINNE